MYITYTIFISCLFYNIIKVYTLFIIKIYNKIYYNKKVKIEI